MTPREQLEDLIVDYDYGHGTTTMPVTWTNVKNGIDRYTRWVKAEALREAADAMPRPLRHDPRRYLYRRANEIETGS